MITLAVILVFVGCLSLALSQNRHWKNVTGEILLAPVKKTIRRIGWVLLSLALIACIARDGAGFAALMWPLLIAVKSFAIAMILSFRPGLLRPVARLYDALGFGT